MRYAPGLFAVLACAALSDSRLPAEEAATVDVGPFREFFARLVANADNATYESVAIDAQVSGERGSGLMLRFRALKGKPADLSGCISDPRSPFAWHTGGVAYWFEPHRNRVVVVRDTASSFTFLLTEGGLQVGAQPVVRPKDPAWSIVGDLGPLFEATGDTPGKVDRGGDGVLRYARNLTERTAFEARYLPGNQGAPAVHLVFTERATGKKTLSATVELDGPVDQEPMRFPSLEQIKERYPVFEISLEEERTLDRSVAVLQLFLKSLFISAGNELADQRPRAEELVGYPVDWEEVEENTKAYRAWYRKAVPAEPAAGDREG